MYVIAIHTISDPEKFFAAAEEGTSRLPEGVELPCVLPSTDGSKTICLWRADSVDTVRALVEEMVGAFSSNEYFAVNDEQAMGLADLAG